MRTNKKVHAVTSILAIAGSFAFTSSAGAAVSCSYESPHVAKVQMSAHFDSARLNVEGGNIVVRNQQDNIVACPGTGGPPTVTNTNTVIIVDNSDDPQTSASGDGNAQARIIGPSDFGPGKTQEQGNDAFSEIEFIVNLGTGQDDFFQLFGTAATDHWVLGSSGINFNANVADPAPDSELILSSQFDRYGLQAGGGDDVISARGGPGVGGPYTGAGEIQAYGEGDNDQMLGGDSTRGDYLDGDVGNDTVQSFGGPDHITGGPGDDGLDGGADADQASYYGSTPVAVDLNLTGAQQTGLGADSLTSVEGVTGSDRGDTLIGTPGANTFQGAQGDDFIDGRGGPDTLRGGGDSDTVTYALAPSSVTANLAAGTAVGGFGPDILDDVENLIGSRFSDNLVGSAAPNAITGGAGPDAVSALAGADTIEVRDGESDIATCGSGTDSVTADRRSQDSVNADCENTSFLPEPPVADPGAAAGAEAPQAAQDTMLSFELRGARAQRVLRRKAVLVRLRCPLEACATVAGATGRLALRPAAGTLRAGTAKTVRLRLGKAQLATLRRALAARKRQKLNVTVQAVDLAGNRVTRTLGVRVTG